MGLQIVAGLLVGAEPHLFPSAQDPGFGCLQRDQWGDLAILRGQLLNFGLKLFTRQRPD